jgi:flagellar P-ring protein precursor FlgI
VVGLAGTGDGGKYNNTLRALASLHRRYENPVLDLSDLKSNDNVALVAVEVTIPENGAREGQALDVVVSALGPAKSLAGGQLLTTPLQEATLSILNIFALAGGRIELTDIEQPTRGLIRRGATLEQDFFYNFISDNSITLVLDDTHAGFPFAQMVARAINHELAIPAFDDNAPDAQGVAITPGELASAIGPKNVRVTIPGYEAAQPAGFVSRVLQAPLFAMPQQPARVLINRTTKNIAFTGNVTISPTILQIPGLGTVSIGGGGGAEGDTAGVIGLDTQKAGGAEFQDLLNTLSSVKLPPAQMVEAVEHLHRTGTLHAELIYTE